MSGERAINRPPEVRPGLRLREAGASLLPVVALAVVILTTGATLTVAGDTLGYDFRAYHAAATRVLAGGPAYDSAFQLAGAFGLFFYPPTFVPLVLPFGLLPVGPATWTWIALLGLASAAAVVAMPVSTHTRWLVVLLAGLSWPFVYNFKLGQVGPILLLTFALGWRLLQRPGRFGVVAAIGAAVKVQPGLILAWALLTRRWVALTAGAATLVVLGIAGTMVAGVDAWRQFLELLARVSDPIITPQNCTPGAVAWQLGMPRDVAGGIQLVSMALVVLAVVVAALRLPAVPSYLVAVVGSQLVSPVLWDHYAIVLLLPVAWLLDRGRWWSVLIPLATSVVFVGGIPAALYPIAFAVTLVALFVEGRSMGTAAPGGRAAHPVAAGA